MEGIEFDENIHLSIKKEKIDVDENSSSNTNTLDSVEEINGVADKVVKKEELDYEIMEDEDYKIENGNGEIKKEDDEENVNEKENENEKEESENEEVGEKEIKQEKIVKMENDKDDDNDDSDNEAIAVDEENEKENESEKEESENEEVGEKEIKQEKIVKMENDEDDDNDDSDVEAIEVDEENVNEKENETEEEESENEVGEKEIKQEEMENDEDDDDSDDSDVEAIEVDEDKQDVIEVDDDDDEDGDGDDDSEEEERVSERTVVYSSVDVQEEEIPDENEGKDEKLTEKAQTCQKCGKTFQSVEYFQIHLRLHSEGRLAKFPERSEPIAGTSGTSSKSEGTHVIDSSDSDSEDKLEKQVNYTTSATNQKFRSRLREGRDDLLVEGPRVCKFCGKTFYSMDYYRIHQRIHVNEKLKHVPLQRAKKPTPSTSSARPEDHQVISVYPQMGVLDVKPSPTNNAKMPGTKRCCTCDVCHLDFPNYRSLVLHRKVHRKGLCTVYPLYICQVCNRGFVSKASFLSHCEFHDAKPWTCNICGMNFSKKIYLGMHKSSKHKHKANDFKCEECGQTFEKRQSLTHHMKTHTSSKSQGQIEISCVCEICGKNLNLKTTKDLRVHMGLHFGEILQCHICPEIFRETDEFKEHMDRHLGL